MTVSSQTRSGELSEVLKTERSVINNQLRVALPGIVQSFDPDTVTVVVQPAIRYIERDSDGNESTHDYPLLTDVPVYFQRGGGCTITFPVKAGDECLVVFSDRCIDFWWQNGGVQEPVDPRQHDLSDAFAFVGPQSQAQKISGISTTTLQMRTDDGSAYIELDPNNKAVNVVAPGGFNVTTPLATFSQAVTISGLLTWAGGMVGSIAAGTAAKITGAIQFIGSLTSNGKDISNGHTHKGVQQGNDSTGGVN
ncbi:translation initiation factor IF-2 [Pantoea ananatis]|uniref:Gp138 family membrane-puncturing spike protein n=1 Tax=Pantoea sp. JZ2 TaxID=2654189 RepID=UPI0006A1EB17|nr:Gp138 family membrane-puncturing spike protein [Pantoea sp. JZ2]KNA28282.1 translation initiation factor IF-2 [Pantoea ananatis]WRH14950.1 translation initiation factor IF-2 [Pantoea sp. JZ2]